MLLKKDDKQMLEEGGSTYIAGDKVVLLNLLSNRGVERQGVTCGHVALVFLLVPGLRDARQESEIDAFEL